LHSGTKYLNGHSDVVLGCVVTNDQALATKIAFLQNGLGAILSPFDSYMVMRGMKTLGLRMQRHGENAMKVAEFLEQHPKVKKVVYPGLKSHPQHNIAVEQNQNGFGGMITFYLKGGLEESKVFLETLELFACAESLGAVECLAEHPAIMTHASVPPEMRAKLGIDDSLVRLSIGIEEIEDIIADLTKGFDAVQ